MRQDVAAQYFVVLRRMVVAFKEQQDGNTAG